MEILGNLSDKLGSILVGFSTIALVVLAVVELIGRTFQRTEKRKLITSMILGPVFGVMAYWLELVDVPLHGDDLSELTTFEHQLRHWMGAAFLGFASTMLAKVVHDVGIVGTVKEAAGKLMTKKSEG